jgi:hypothetical protein
VGTLLYSCSSAKLPLADGVASALPLGLRWVGAAATAAPAAAAAPYYGG